MKGKNHQKRAEELALYTEAWKQMSLYVQLPTALSVLSEARDRINLLRRSAGIHLRGFDRSGKPFILTVTGKDVMEACIPGNRTREEVIGWLKPVQQARHEKGAKFALVPVGRREVPNAEQMDA